MENPLMVFISSIMNPQKDDLLQERKVVKDCINGIPITRSWRFEDSPASSERVDSSYLNKVRECDIFLIILSRDITEPVKKEYSTAVKHQKPCLVFLKQGSNRTTDLQAFIRKIDVKYKEFTSLSDFRQQVQEAILDELIKGYRKFNISDEMVRLQDMQKLPQIHVGPNFSGQFAIGEGITQLRLVNCMLVFPDGTQKHGQAWRYYQSDRPNTNTDQIFGRQAELNEIGIGKSTVTSLFVERKEKSGAYAGIYWRSIHENSTIREIVGSFFAILNRPIERLEGYTTHDLIAMLCEELRNAPYLLVLDNFERLLNPQTNTPHRTEFSEFLERILDNIGASRVLLTSWECPVSSRGLRPAVCSLDGLESEAAIRLLRRR
jgi:hypothetical protein